MVFTSGSAPAAHPLPLAPGRARSRAPRDAEPAESAKSALSFESQLASAIEQYLNTSDNGSRIEISLADPEGQNTGARQFIVTVLEPGAESQAAPAASGSTAAPAAPELSPNQMMMYSGAVEYVPQPEAAPAAAAPTNVVDAYWATQPPEVQQLRDIKDEGERTLRAQELAGQGFAIDVPIMVWQWEPFMTMRAREQAGYTWVPSASNKPIELGPGIDFPGLEPYDPNNPPPGAIQVTTEFAKGLENTSIWWRPGIFAEPEPPAAQGS